MRRHSTGRKTFFTLFALGALLLFAANAVGAASAGGSTGGGGGDLFLGPGMIFIKNAVSQFYPKSEKLPQWEIDYANRRAAFPATAEGDAAAPFIQRGSLRDGEYSLLAEMGKLDLPGLPDGFSDRAYQGARLSLGSGFSGNSLKLSLFSATTDGLTGNGERHSGASRSFVVAGASGDMGLFTGKAHVRTSFVAAEELSGIPREDLNLAARDMNKAEISTSMDPFGGRLVAESKFVVAGIVRHGHDASLDARDTGFSFRLGGKSGSCGYHADIERKIPEYALSGAEVTREETDRYSVGYKLDQKVYSLVLDLSRQLSGIRGNSTHYDERSIKGTAAFSYNGIPGLPVVLQYSRTLDSVVWEDDASTGKTETDAFSGDVRYLGGMLNWNLKGKFSQRYDMVGQKREQIASALSFSPKIVLDDLSIAHSVSVRRLYLFADKSRTDSYALKLGAKGRFPGESLDYELNGGFLRTEYSASETVNETISSNFRISTPFPRLFDEWTAPSFGIKGEYKNHLKPTVGQGDFSLYLSFESG